MAAGVSPRFQACIPRSRAASPARREPARVEVERAELGVTAVCLLEVVADQLIGAVREPLGQPLVEIRPLGLRQACVGDVADQDVMEAEASRTTPAARSPRARAPPAGPRSRPPLRGARAASAAREHAPDHGGALQ